MQWAWRQKEIMLDILWRDEFTCQLCGSHRHLQVHHIKPRSKGGDNSEDNLLTLCRDCHEDVHQGRTGFMGTLMMELKNLNLTRCLRLQLIMIDGTFEV